MTMLISLSTQAAPESWGKNAILSANNEGMAIHLSDLSDITTIQRAARKIKSQGISDVALVGDGWNLAQCWAFHQGFTSVKNAGTVKYPHLGEDQAEFDARLTCSQFMREIINAPSDQLTPEQLAQQAAQFIQQQAVEKGLNSAVSYHIIAGEDLKAQNYMGIWTVGKGSENAPAMLQLDFNPTGNADAPVFACLVGNHF